MALDIRRVKLNRGGYDRRGRYYGVGERLYCYADDMSKCVRAPTAKAAREVFKREHRLEGLPPVRIPRSHLRKDISEAKSMIRELKRGIARDEKALRKRRSRR